MDKANIIMSGSWEWELEREKKHDDECQLQLQYYYDSNEEVSSSTCGCGFIGFKRNQVFDYSLSPCSNEIGDEEEGSSEELFEINILNKEPQQQQQQQQPLDTIREEYCESTVFSLDIDNDDNIDVVYVVVEDYGDSSSSMEALSWALKHAVTPSTTTLSLLHVFPQVKFIPTPLGKIPRNHINPEHVNVYLTLEKAKRKLLLQKFIDLCVAAKVKVETMLIEGDSVAKAIVDLVGNLNIRKLVIGTTQSNLRKAGSRRQNVIAEMVLKNAQESCDIKIICEGREVIDQMINIGDFNSPRSSDSSRSSVSSSHELADESRANAIVPLKRNLMPNPLRLFMPRF